jgi:hypothetical protein
MVDIVVLGQGSRKRQPPRRAAAGLLQYHSFILHGDLMGERRVVKRLAATHMIALPLLEGEKGGRGAMSGCSIPQQPPE